MYNDKSTVYVNEAQRRFDDEQGRGLSGETSTLKQEAGT
jgi:hypothetical protein